MEVKTDRERALEILKGSENPLPTDRSAETWQECFRRAQVRSHITNISTFWDKVREKEMQELTELAAKLPPETDFQDVSRYNHNGTFDAQRFIADKSGSKTTWEGHILSPEDLAFARAEMSAGVPKGVIHDRIKQNQHERQKQQTQKQIDFLNSQKGNQPFCSTCMGRGYNAVMANDLYIELQICGCQRAREKQADDKRKAEQETKNRRKQKPKEQL